MPFGGAARHFQRSLRGVTPPDIYGLKGLTADTKATVRKETLVALRIADLAKTLGLQQTPWLLAAPAADGPRVLLIPEIRALLSMPGVAASRLDHTEGGFAGRTVLVGNVGFLDVPRVATRTPAGADSGENYFSSGCAPQLDDWWFSTVKATLTENPAEFSASGSLDPHRAPAVVPRIQCTAKLRGEQLDAKELRDLFDSQSLAGLRNTAEAISRLPFHRQLGSILSQLFEKLCAKTQWYAKCY